MNVAPRAGGWRELICESRATFKSFLPLDTNVGVGLVGRARGWEGIAGQGSCDPRPVLASSGDTPDAL